MATHHEARRLEYIARDVDGLAAMLEREAKDLRAFATLLKEQEDNGTPLRTDEKHNIRNNTRRAVFNSMHTSGFNSSVETLLGSLDRLVDEEA